MAGAPFSSSGSWRLSPPGYTPAHYPTTPCHLKETRMRLAVVVIMAIADVGTTDVQAQNVQVPRGQVIDSEGVLVGELVDVQPFLTVLFRVDRLTFYIHLESKYEFRST